MPSLLEARFWGPLACFTRPEMKVERVSYPVMTPSAARGALEAIYWKPEFSWQVREIWMLRPLRFASFVRNEVKEKMPLSARPGSLFLADDHRTQRQTVALQDVAYLVRADIVTRHRAQDQDLAKYRDQFRRRVERGKCFHNPYLGCREFLADFGPSRRADVPVPLTEDLGAMLFDLRYAPEGDRAEPLFFEARLESGVLHVPPRLYDRLEAQVVH